MGLLSDPEYGSAKWVKVLKKIHFPLCFLCYISSIVWFFMLAHREFNNETYFSENALLPGLVTNEFNGEHSANKFFTEFIQELEDKYDESNEMPVPWLVGKMSQLGLEVYTHNFSLNYPLGQGQTYKGTNVYGILRAPRTSSLEALVVTAPYRSLSNHQKGTTAGIALMLAFAQFARPQKYWAKDIIFLITEHEQLGMQAWLEAYHGLKRESSCFYSTLGSFWQPGGSGLDLGKLTKSFEWITDHNKCLDPGVLKGRSGSIQAAINLEFHTPKFKYVEVKVEGLNGQLPNLDLVNLVHKLCLKSGIHHSYKNSYSWTRKHHHMDEWVNNIWTMLGMVSTQIAGVPNGNHGLFHRFGIEAVTLEGRESNDPAGDPPRMHTLVPGNFFRLGVALESILRSLNNLLERFHQSYFFYMLAATNRFISIGQYMPSLCLLCGAMLIHALCLWVSLQKDEEPTESEPDKNLTEKSELLKDTDQYEDMDKEKEKENEPLIKKRQMSEIIVAEKKTLEVNFSVVNVGGNYLFVHVLGYVVMNSPLIFSKIGATYFDQPSEVSVYYGLISVSVFLIVFTPFLLRFWSTPLTFEDMSMINILLLIELSTACLAIGMHNFPLGLSIAVLYTPLALLVGVVVDNRGKRSAIALLLKRLLCLLLQPLFAVSIALILYSRVLFPEEAILSMLGRGRDAAMQAVMFSIVDSMIYGNWLFNVGATIILPTWILFWQILCSRVKENADQGSGMGARGVTASRVATRGRELTPAGE
ncbi:glycosylphosphatidylinositol anchor attachment 1 protein [Maniola hyperantus]|uniref:glycosylphosphatidylinositol anchor attachment 1 protein n=1 Tax=Aphantopus hyperantus TaxID=2795564 RepID=UPI00156A3710|nr:glycosylphosphatidylinositol anchor attachment 1 protein [Maniola hyperantus]